MNKKKLLKEIKSWLKDYEDNEEHDIDLCITLKEDASILLVEALKLIEE